MPRKRFKTQAEISAARRAADEKLRANGIEPAVYDPMIGGIQMQMNNPDAHDFHRAQSEEESLRIRRGK